jgi:hypothetical protein
MSWTGVVWIPFLTTLEAQAVSTPECSKSSNLIITLRLSHLWYRLDRVLLLVLISRSSILECASGEISPRGCHATGIQLLLLNQ